MLKKKIFAVAMVACSQGVLAQQPPSAGSQMQQIPPPPTPSRVVPRVEVAPRQAPVTPDLGTVKIVVKRLIVTGARAYSAAELLAVTGFVPGSELSLADLRGMAARIADYYHRNGYFVAQAYLPAQDIKDGTVTIAVIDGQYGKITLNNQTNVANSLANGLLGGVASGDAVQSAPLESALLLLSDLPGVNVKSTLLPGAAVGTSDLIVNMTPGQRVSGEVDVDNAGNRYTGEYRFGATINFNEPTGNGDVASLRALTSGAGLNYARASYQMQFGKARAGVAYSMMAYKLGREFESLRANGTADIASIYGSYPLVRSRNDNLYVGLAFDAKTFRDKVDATAFVGDKKAQVLMASLYGDHRDNFGGGGASAYSLTWSAGHLNIETAAVQAADAATAQSNGSYNKLAFRASRLQNITQSVALYAAINGQVASKNLDIAEKMELGGMYGVRAYPEGEAYADQGYVLNLEARWLLPKYSDRMAGQLQLIGFVDTGSVTTDKTPWAAGSNHRRLSGAGVGLSWSDNDNFVVRAYYARKLGNETATSAPDKAGRFWIQAVKYF